jgi:ABC-2 type transport system ATP-binding protein
MEIFSARNVNKVFADTKALTDVSISVNKQSIFGLLGPNGAGKTTLIRIINQITAPDSGEVFLEGRKMTSADIGHIGYLPEERGLYKKMKIGDQAIYLAQLKGMSRHDAIKNLKIWFEKFEIMSWWNKNIEELSKGMQQKVQFITTIVHQPKLLIFDEPFSGFDPINANLLKQEILQLRENGATIIFSTHNMESVEELCDHIALINKSVKIVDGQTDEIRERYKSNVFEVRYKGSFNEVNKALNNQFKILSHIENNRLNQITIEYLHGKSNNDLIQALIPVSEILSFEEKIPSMNDVFIRAVEESNKIYKMNKTLLILKNEYLKRVKKKSFIILTLLVPFLFAGMFALIIFLSINNDKKERTIAVFDESTLFLNELNEEGMTKYKFIPKEEYERLKR